MREREKKKSRNKNGKRKITKKYKTPKSPKLRTNNPLVFFFFKKKKRIGNKILELYPRAPNEMM